MKALLLTGLVAHLCLESGASHTAELERALALNAQKQGEAANQVLAELSEHSESRRVLGLDLVEAWWRVAHQERAINTLSKWRQEAPRSPDPLERARARALTGSPFDLDAFFTSLKGPDAAEGAHCQLLELAFSLDAVGQRDTGQMLLERAWAERACPNEAEVRAAWEQPKAKSAEPLRGAIPKAPASTRYVLGPGHESKVVKIMPQQGDELPAGVGLIDLSIPEVAVEARYGPLDASAESCDTAPLCVSLHHPTQAASGDRLVGDFALRTRGEGRYEEEALLDGISARIRAQGEWNPWRKVRTSPEPDEAAHVAPESPAPRPQADTEGDEGSPPWLWIALFGLAVVALVAKAARAQERD